MKQITGLITAFVAAGAVSQYRLMAFGEEANTAKQATATTDKLIGVSTRLNQTAGEHIDIVRSGIAPVMYGEALKRGDWVTADVQGRAVKATDKQACIGIAEQDGDADDLGAIFITHGIFVAA